MHAPRPAAWPISTRSSPAVDKLGTRSTDGIDYSPGYVKALFDEMSVSYDRVNLITSFGFSQRWRRQCVAALPPAPEGLTYDLMTGAGEAWPYVLAGLGTQGRLVAIDFSPGMLALARSKQAPDDRVRILEQDLLDPESVLEPADRIVSVFGLKTFSPEQLEAFVLRLRALLRPGGSFSLLEISDPRLPGLRQLYMFYLKRVIPMLGKLLLGNPENYRMLGVYTAGFGNCERLSRLLAAAGFEVSYRSYFFGCASGVVGRLPD